MTPPCGVPAIRGTTLPSSNSYRSFQPALDVELHPRALRVFTDCFQKQIPIDAAQSSPARRSAPKRQYSAGFPDCINRRPARPIPVGVPCGKSVPGWAPGSA